MINAWQWESQKRLPSLQVKAGWIVASEVSSKSQFLKCGSWTRLISYAFLKNEPAIIWKVATCQRITSKNHSNSLGRYLSPRYGQAILVSWNIILTAVNQSKHGCTISLVCLWCGRTEGRVVGQVIAEFSRMDRFSKLWGFELSPWSHKISATNFKNYVTSMDRKMSPWYSQVMMVSVYSRLTAVN